jgi:hypothetical protein
MVVLRTIAAIPAGSTLVAMVVVAAIAPLVVPAVLIAPAVVVILGVIFVDLAT